MTVGMNVKRRITVDGRVYGVGVYPRGVPDEHALEIVNRKAGNIIAEQELDPAPPTEDKGPDLKASISGQVETKQITKKSLAQKKRRQLQKAKDEAQRQQQEQQLIAEAEFEPVVEVEDQPEPEPVNDDELKAIQALAGPLPDDLPGKALYEAGGITDLKVLVNLGSNDLLKVPGVTEDLITQGRLWVVSHVRQQAASTPQDAPPAEAPAQSPPAASVAGTAEVDSPPVPPAGETQARQE